jgi:hypothetical protein
MKKHHSFLPALAIAITGLTAGFEKLAHASSEALTFEHACEPNEKWSPEDNPIAPYLQTRIQWSAPDKNPPGLAMKSLLRSLAADSRAHGERSKALVSYWQARAMYDLKLSTEAHHAFNQILVNYKGDESLPLRTAAMACLIRMHQKYPSLTLEPAAVQAVANQVSNVVLSVEEKAPFYQGLLWELKNSASSARAAAIAQKFAGGGFYERAANALVAARTPNEGAILKNEELLEDPLFEKLSQDEQDQWHYLFGMAYYGARDYKQAIAQFKKIPNNSNLLVRSLSSLAWSYLWLNRYEEAMGSAENLVTGTLRKTFSPEGFETLSIALNETCNFNAALDTYHRFQRTYATPYRYLTELEKSGSKDYYNMVTMYFRQKIKVPDRIGVEWLGDPTFIAAQSEINMGVDAVLAARRARKLAGIALREPEAKKWKWAPLWQKFDMTLYGDLQKIPARKIELTEMVNRSIAAKNAAMRDQLLHTAENLQLLEAEAYETLGDELIAENSPQGPNAKVAKDNKKHARNQGAVWDWGRYPASKDSDADDNQEVWQDEVGALHANLKKSCD